MVSPDGTRVYVVNHSEATVSVVDTGTFTVTRTFPLGFGSPNGITISASGKRAYVGTGLGKILVLVGIILFLQWRPAGIFVTKSRSLEG